jgi:hypothetical protein
MGQSRIWKRFWVHGFVKPVGDAPTEETPSLEVQEVEAVDGRGIVRLLLIEKV